MGGLLVKKMLVEGKLNLHIFFIYFNVYINKIYYYIAIIV